MNHFARATLAATVLAAFAMSAQAQSPRDPMGEKAVVGYHMGYAKAQLSTADSLQGDSAAKVAGGVSVRQNGDAELDIVFETLTAKGPYKVVAKGSGIAGTMFSAPVEVNGETRMADILLARVDGCSSAFCPDRKSVV